jgi:predicted phage terminase large subunit-like protein
LTNDSRSLSRSEKLEALRIAKEIEQRRKRAQIVQTPSLAEFVEATTQIVLDPWQHTLCARLERLKHETGQRLLIAAPPQIGKSLIVSQRFPAWLIGIHPTTRIRQACYNITQATRFTKIVRDLIQMPEYKRYFPKVALPTVTSGDEWTTLDRAALRDAQPTMKALGLATGFVGMGADCLLIDDPYASPQDALSQAVRDRTWMFWDDSARVRLNEETNVVVMFHRYHEEDLAGRLIAEGGWEQMNFPAVADNDPHDPTGRTEGEILSPRWSPEFVASQQKSPRTFMSQFQGKPAPKDGAMFETAAMPIVGAGPAKAKRVRAWDKAASLDGDWTVGVLMSYADGVYTIEDVTRFRELPTKADAIILQTAHLDRSRYGKVMTRGPQDPGQAGVRDRGAFTRLLAGFRVSTYRDRGSKTARAEEFASQCGGGNVQIVEAPWNKAVIDELSMFPFGSHDDIVDAGSEAFRYLCPNARRNGIGLAMVGHGDDDDDGYDDHSYGA